MSNLSAFYGLCQQLTYQVRARLKADRSRAQARPSVTQQRSRSHVTLWDSFVQQFGPLAHVVDGDSVYVMHDEIVQTCLAIRLEWRRSGDGPAPEVLDSMTAQAAYNAIRAYMQPGREASGRIPAHVELEDVFQVAEWPEEDPAQVDNIHRAVFAGLTQVEQIALRVYAETGSFAEAARATRDPEGVQLSEDWTRRIIRDAQRRLAS
jgi:hypothetical protein